MACVCPQWIDFVKLAVCCARKGRLESSTVREVDLQQWLRLHGARFWFQTRNSSVQLK